MKGLLVATTLALLGSAAHAQLRSEPISVYPANVSADGAFLILVEDSWSDGCGGSVSTRVGSSSIDIVATLASPILGRVCTAVVTPFKRVINPRDMDGATDFDAEVTINYSVNNGNGEELRQSQVLTFSDTVNQPTQLQSGGWTTSKLERSGLFIDQQAGTLSAALFDYGEDNQASWHYAAGSVNGNVFVADLVTYGLIQCFTAPCPRTAPLSHGRINMILNDANEALVGFDGISFPGSAVDADQDAMVYSRLDFSRSPGLPPIPDDGNPAVPDLVGGWVGGVAATRLSRNDFRGLVVQYIGVDRTNGLVEHRFDAFDSNLFSLPVVPTPEFHIYCADFRPVDGSVGCRLEGYHFGGTGGQECSGWFEYSAVAADKVVGQAHCGIDGGDNAEQFELYRRY